jgi:hypothetical protein
MSREYVFEERVGEEKKESSWARWKAEGGCPETTKIS